MTPTEFAMRECFEKRIKAGLGMPVAVVLWCVDDQRYTECFDGVGQAESFACQLVLSGVGDYNVFAMQKRSA